MAKNLALDVGLNDDDEDNKESEEQFDQFSSPNFSSGWKKKLRLRLSVDLSEQLLDISKNGTLKLTKGLKINKSGLRTTAGVGGLSSLSRPSLSR